MARPKGSRNTALSRQERRALIETLRQAAARGDRLAALALLSIPNTGAVAQRQEHDAARV